MTSILLTGKIARLWALLMLPIFAATAGLALLAPPAPEAGYDCLVVPGAATQPEWMLDVTHGVSVWDRRALDAPFRYVQTTSPNGRYQIVRSQRIIDTDYQTLGWFLEDNWTASRTELDHSAGFDVWSADSRVIAYLSEPVEQPRRLTIFEPETGASHTESLRPDEYIESLSADGRYLLLQNALDFERRVVETADFREVISAGESGQWQSTPWPPQGNFLVLLDDGVPTLFGLEAATRVALDGLPRNAATRNTVWSPDGSRFAVVSLLSDSSYGLNIFDTQGESLIEPVLSPVVPVPLPQFGRWSDDGTRFGFIQDESLMVVDTVTQTVDTLVERTERMGMTWTYSPASSAYLPLVHLEEMGMALTVVDVRTMRVAGKLVENAARIDLPFWSSDASRVAVKWDTAQGQTRLSWANSSDFITHDLAEPGRFYSEDTPLDNTARWLDSGTMLLYSAYRDDESGIYVANVDTGDIHRLTGDIDWANPHITLASSPQGDRMVMSYRPQSLNGPSAFVLFRTDGTYTRSLPTDSYVMPVWSPDGQRIAHWDTTSSAILVYDADGETLLRTSAAPPNGGFDWTTCRPRA